MGGAKPKVQEQMCKEQIQQGILSAAVNRVSGRRGQGQGLQVKIFYDEHMWILFPPR